MFVRSMEIGLEKLEEAAVEIIKEGEKAVEKEIKYFTVMQPDNLNDLTSHDEEKLSIFLIML